jgi:HrpA-like RNA helicase
MLCVSPQVFLPGQEEIESLCTQLNIQLTAMAKENGKRMAMVAQAAAAAAKTAKSVTTAKSKPTKSGSHGSSSSSSSSSSSLNLLPCPLFVVRPFFAAASAEQQRAAFVAPPTKQHRKFVVATNIAETSVTIR